MKIITERQYGEIVLNIIKERKKKVEKASQSFNGVNGDDLNEEVARYLGDEWMVTNEQPVKFTRGDINAVAGARYFRKGGITLVMGLLIIQLLLAITVKSLIIMTPLYFNLYYVLCGLIALGFIWVYSHKQSKIRKELWRQLGREESAEK